MRRIPRELTLKEWSDMQIAYPAKVGERPCIRIDGTIFSTARHYGAFWRNRQLYTVFYFAAADGNTPVNDSTTVYGPMIGVSERMLKWVAKRLKAESERGKRGLNARKM